MNHARTVVGMRVARKLGRASGVLGRPRGASRDIALYACRVDPATTAGARQFRARAEFLAALVLALTGSPTARADDGGSPPPPAVQAPPVQSRPHWDAAWSHGNAWDYSLAAVGASFSILAETVLEQHPPPMRWNGPILFDNDVRGFLRSSDAGTRATAEDLAWGLWGLQVAYPVFVDVPYAWIRGGRRLAADLFWQDAATLTIAGAIDLGLRDIAARARPGTYDCVARGGSNCFADLESTRSFPGGHTTNSTAASVLTCTQHFYTHLYGGPWDASLCAATLASDATIVVLRIVSDNHWATDQLAGVALGTLVGWGIPYLMHFHGHAASTDETAFGRAGIFTLPMPLAFDHGGGMGLTGLF